MAITRREFMQVGARGLGFMALNPPEILPHRPPKPDLDEARAISEDFARFVDSVTNGFGIQVTGFYAAGKLALPVVQQHESNPAYVAPGMVVTQFNLGSWGYYDDVILLAEALFTGSLIKKIGVSEQLSLVNGDGSIRNYIVRSIRRFWADTPESGTSDFTEVNLQNEKFGESYTVGRLFKHIYLDDDALDDELTVQTCEFDNLGNPVIRRWVKAHLIENGKV